jgi:hypothetical protein
MNSWEKKQTVDLFLKHNGISHSLITFYVKIYKISLAIIRRHVNVHFAHAAIEWSENEMISKKQFSYQICLHIPKFNL